MRVRLSKRKKGCDYFEYSWKMFYYFHWLLSWNEFEQNMEDTRYQFACNSKVCNLMTAAAWMYRSVFKYILVAMLLLLLWKFAPAYVLKMLGFIEIDRLHASWVTSVVAPANIVRLIVTVSCDCSRYFHTSFIFIKMTSTLHSIRPGNKKWWVRL